MKSLLTILTIKLTCLFIMEVSGQAKLSPQARMFEKDIQEYTAVQAKKPELPESLIEEYALIDADTAWMAGAVIEVDPDVADADIFELRRISIGSQIGEIWTVRFPVQHLERLKNIPGVKYIEMGAGYGPELDKSNADTRTDQVHEGLGELHQAYKGEDVIIAVIDWGFDYTHPQFYDEDMEEFRIKAVWDQNHLDLHKPPLNFNYGTFLTEKELILKQQMDDEYLYGAFSHGTHVGGIAGGAGAGTQFKGKAPASDLIFISLRRDAPSLIEAFELIDYLAERAGKPYVVNMSFGGHYGPHDGTDLPNRAISELAGPGKIFVSSAGNNGNSGGFHINREFDQDADTIRSSVGFGPNRHQTISMWNSPGDQFKTRITIYDPFGNEKLHQTEFLNTEENPFKDYLFPVRNDFDTAWVRMAGEASSFLNDKPNMRIEIKLRRPQVVTIEVAADSGNFHMWNVERTDFRYANWGRPFSDQLGNTTMPDFTSGDDNYAVGEPGGVGKDVITIGAHNTKSSYMNIDSHDYKPPITGTVNEIASFSSRGPTVDGRNKPAVTAPGNTVVSSVNSFEEINDHIIAAEVNFNDRTYQYQGMSGTSMAGPAAAGIVALMLEANPDLDHNEVRHILMETARQDEFTGELEPGNNHWGAGKIDALAAVEMAADYPAHLNDDDQLADRIQIAPNPSNGNFDLFIERLDPPGNDCSFTIIDALGKVRASGKLNTGHSGNLHHEFELNELQAGVYFLSIQTRDGMITKRFVMQE